MHELDTASQSEYVEQFTVIFSTKDTTLPGFGLDRSHTRTRFWKFRRRDDTLVTAGDKHSDFTSPRLKSLSVTTVLPLKPEELFGVLHELSSKKV